MSFLSGFHHYSGIKDQDIDGFVGTQHEIGGSTAGIERGEIESDGLDQIIAHSALKSVEEICFGQVTLLLIAAG